MNARYESVAVCVDRVPRTATEIYKRWAKLPEWKALTNRHRNERRWLADVLVNLTNRKVIARGTDGANIYFWRVDADEAAADPAVRSKRAQIADSTR